MDGIEEYRARVENRSGAHDKPCRSRIVRCGINSALRLRPLPKTSASSALNFGQCVSPAVNILAGLIFVFLLTADAGAAVQSLDAKRYFLRSGNAPEWQEFEGKAPHGSRLDIRFMTQKNSAEATLFIRQSDVK